jgi:hypothetical protein
MCLFSHVQLCRYNVKGLCTNYEDSVFLETLLSSVLSKDFRIVSKVARCSQILLQLSYDKWKKK